jgi:hypothetical protein
MKYREECINCYEKLDEKNKEIIRMKLYAKDLLNENTVMKEELKRAKKNIKYLASN